MKGNKTQLIAMTAEWLLPVSSAAVRHGVIVLEGREIVEVTDREAFAERYGNLSIEDFGRAVIMPGLINLHTHLDYTGQRYFNTEASLFDWIPGLVANGATWSLPDWRDSAIAGAKEVALSGTSLIVDSSFSGQAADAAAQVGLRAVVGLELFGVIEDRADKQWEDWLNKFDRFTGQAGDETVHAIAEGLLTLTVSPHAPYSVSPALWKRACEWAKSRALPVLAHVSETASEVEWIKGSNKTVDEFLSVVMPELSDESACTFDWKGRGLSPAAHLENYRLLEAHTVAAHCAHLSETDINIFKDRNVGVAHCPRSNARLRSGIAPFIELRNSGLEIGFGTDSAASVDNLDVRKEARFALNLHRALNPHLKLNTKDIVQHLTLGAARALHMDARLGSLVKGKLADIAVFGLDVKNSNASLTDQIIYGDPPLKHLFVGGSQVVADGKLVAGERVTCE